jgi:predicted transcriptional regulator
LKKARSMTDDELKVRWHSKYLKMLLASGMMEQEANKKATVDANNRSVELKKNYNRTHTMN